MSEKIILSILHNLINLKSSSYEFLVYQSSITVWKAETVWPLLTVLAEKTEFSHGKSQIRISDGQLSFKIDSKKYNTLNYYPRDIVMCIEAAREPKFSSV